MIDYYQIEFLPNNHLQYIKLSNDIRFYRILKMVASWGSINWDSQLDSNIVEYILC